MKRKRENKVLTTLFVVMDYLLFYKEHSAGNEVYPGVNVTLSPRDKRDEAEKPACEDISPADDPLIDYQQTKEGARVIDSVLAMTLHILLEFDWGTLADSVKPREDPIHRSNSESEGETAFVSGGEGRRSINVVGFMLRSLGKQLSRGSRSFFVSPRRNRRIHTGLPVQLR